MKPSRADGLLTLLADIRHNSCNPMPGETLNAPLRQKNAPPAADVLPKRLLYSIFARIGGSGLDTDAFETLRASYRGGFLGKAVAFRYRKRNPRFTIHSMRWHSVRLLSFLDSPYYTGEKEIHIGLLPGNLQPDFDVSQLVGDCLESSRVARRLRIPSIVNPTGTVIEKTRSGAIRAPPRPRMPIHRKEIDCAAKRFLKNTLQIAVVLSNGRGHVPRPGFWRKRSSYIATRRRRERFNRKATIRFPRDLFRRVNRAKEFTTT